MIEPTQGLRNEGAKVLLPYLQKATEENPNDADTHYSLGDAYSELGRWQEAIESFKQAIRIKPDYANAHHNLGVAYFKLGRYQDAIEAFKQAIRIKPDLAEAHCNLGVAYGEIGHWQDEIEACKQAIRIEPDDATAHYNLGCAYGSLGRYQDEIESYKQAIRIKPDYANAHHNLGVAYGKLGVEKGKVGHWQEGIKAYKQAIKGRKMKKLTWDSAKTLCWGVVLLIGGCWFWCWECGNPLHELALIRRAQITTGVLVDTHEYEQQDYRDHVYYSDVGIYSYRLPDGREFKTSIRVPTGQLKVQQEVEYLPNNPEVSRIKGDGCNSVTEWLWRKVGFGSLFLVICISPGIYLVKKAFSENTKSNNI